MNVNLDPIYTTSEVGLVLEPFGTTALFVSLIIDIS
jgi:hypothetical protein